MSTTIRRNATLALAANVSRLYRAVLPDPAANELAAECTLFHVIARKIGSLVQQADIAEIMQGVEDLLDESIAAKGYVIRDESQGWQKKLIDLSEIDFETLRAKFNQGCKHIEVERLKGSIEAKLKRMVRLNRSRMDYLEKFQQMIDDYNARSMNVEAFFERLVEFANKLSAEESRVVAEQLSEEELAVFDLLTKPAINLKAKEVQQIKKAARELLEKLKKSKLVLDWRKRQQARAAVRVTIRDVLDEGLPSAFTPERFQEKCDVVYQHVYDSYFGGGRSVYARAA